MAKTSKIVALVLIVALLIIGVGYAAISNVTLDIRGTLAADGKQENFTVKFTGTPKPSDAGKVDATISDDVNAVLNVTGLTTTNESVTAEYTIQNTSAELTANLTANVTDGNDEYFKTEYAFKDNKTSLTHGETTTLVVTVTLLKTPIAPVSTSVGIQITATPAEA